MTMGSEKNILPAVISDWLRRDRERQESKKQQQQIQLELPVPEPLLPSSAPEHNNTVPVYDYNSGVICGVVVDLLG